MSKFFIQPKGADQHSSEMLIVFQIWVEKQSFRVDDLPPPLDGIGLIETQNWASAHPARLLTISAGQVLQCTIF